MVLSSAVMTNGERVLAAIWKSGSACGQSQKHVVQPACGLLVLVLLIVL